MRTEAERAELAELFREFHATGSRRARNRIVELHDDVADVLARRYARRSVPHDDLRQVALLTMLRAVERFDPDHGVEFSTFASRTIDGELKRYFRDKAWAVRPPRRAQELHLELRAAQEAMTHRLHRSPTVRELAAEVGESEDDVLVALEAGRAFAGTSGDAPVRDRSGHEDGVLGDRIFSGEDPGFDHADRVRIVGELLATLDERERRIVELRFYEGRSQEEIATEVGVSQSYLSRMLRRILVDLRSHPSVTQDGDGDGRAREPVR